MSEDTHITEYEEHIPVKSKLGYGFANAGNGILSGLGLGAIDVFYLKVTGLDPRMMALSWILFAAWNAINDPLIGIIQEKTKSKLGRRIPYLRYGSIFYVLSFILIWFPFTSDAQLLFWNHLIMLFVFDTIYSMIGLITYSLPAEMALTQKERGNIMLYSAALGSIGIVIPMVLPLIFLGERADIPAFRMWMIIVAIIAGLMIYLSSYVIKENSYAQMEETFGFFESIKETFKNKPFLILEVSIFAMVIMQNILTGFLVFLTDYIIELNLSNPLNLVMVIILAALLIYSVLWVVKVIPKYGLKKLTIFGSIVGAMGFAILLIIGGIIQPNQLNKMPLAVGFAPLALVIFGLIVFMLTNQPLMADAIDHDELLTGKRRETTYSGVNALITKPAVSIGKAFFLLILGAYGYISAELEELSPPPSAQPLSVATGVIIAFCLIPMICLFVAAISLYFFPLDGPEWFSKKRGIQDVHRMKEEKYIEFLKQQKKEENQ